MFAHCGKRSNRAVKGVEEEDVVFRTSQYSKKRSENVSDSVPLLRVSLLNLESNLRSDVHAATAAELPSESCGSHPSSASRLQDHLGAANISRFLCPHQERSS
ncbi:hypothetical protein OJAV_G00194680 [Oryzias javanicus]|uniref:Uncharacterized protein n=1 Tax=Oryzias javanicus TaxID=123683 RepID=A0A3S2U0Q6_ORYJA|nr:hypothetical protein OJAV_G00194680 [Oryzias javanicus]